MKKTTTAIEVQQPQSPMNEAQALISQAINKNVPVETMEKLLAMRRELKAEKAKEDYDYAMAQFQSECPTIGKNKKAGSGSFTYMYAPLEDIVEKVKDLLGKYGFSYSFDTQQNGKLKVVCKVKHKAGHTEVSEFELEIDKAARMNISQQYGAALTYGKRYAFCSAFGIVVGGEDTDAKVTPKGEELTPDLIEKINATKTHEELVAVCKELKTKIKPSQQKVLVEQYTRRKEELSQELSDDVEKGLAEQTTILTEPK